jgi:hypothetical protein
MTRPKNDKYKDYVRYAENCLNMVATTTDLESRSIQREMAAEWLTAKTDGEVARARKACEANDERGAP